MRRKIKLLTQRVEIKPDGRSVRPSGESMDVQLDRWRIEQAGRAVVLDYVVHTDYEIGAYGQPDTLITRAIVVYADAREAQRYGLASSVDPLEQQLYSDIITRLGRDRLSGRTLVFGPTPLVSGLVHASVDVADTDGDEPDMDLFASEMYDLVIADRTLSRSSDARALVRGIKKAIRKGGLCVVIEDGYAWWGFTAYTRTGLRRALADFSPVAEGSVGNALTTAHKVLSCGLWLPAFPSVTPTEDELAPTYHWMAVTR